MRLRILAPACCVLALLSCRNRTEPPFTPDAPAGPVVCYRLQDSEFTTVTTDPGGLRVSYRFSWGDGDTSDWSPFLEPGLGFTMQHAYTLYQAYEVRSQARNPDAPSYSDWSPPFLTRVGEPPRAPYAPAGRGTGWEDSAYTFSVISPAPSPNRVSYVIDWDDGTGDTSDFHTVRDSVRFEHVWQDTDTYDIRVLAFDQNGLRSSWSSASRMVIRDFGGVLRWKKTECGGTAAPAAGPDRTIYSTGKHGDLKALTPDGTVLWSYRVESDPAHCAPAVGPDGTVYVGGDSGLHALTPQGSRKWIYSEARAVRSPPAIGASGTLYAAASSGFLCAIGPDGTPAWLYEAGDSLYAAPTIGPDGTVYVGAVDGHVCAVDPDGTLRWRFPTATRVLTSPAIGDDGTIFVTCGASLYAINPDGTLRWQLPCSTGARIESSPALGNDGTVYYGSNDNILYAVRPDGTIKWTFTAYDDVRATPAVGRSGTVYFAARSRYFYALNPDGTLKWQARPDAYTQSSALVQDGFVYFGGSDLLFAVYCLDSLADSPWPMYMHDHQHTGRADGQ